MTTNEPPMLRIQIDPYKSSAEIARICRQVMAGRWREGHAAPVPEEQRVRLTQAEAAERLGVTQQAVGNALNESEGGTRYHAVRLRILSEIGGFRVGEARWHVERDPLVGT